MTNNKVTYWRVKHTQLGTDGRVYKYFRTQIEAEKFNYNHLASGGGADEPEQVSYFYETPQDDIDTI